MKRRRKKVTGDEWRKIKTTKTWSRGGLKLIKNKKKRSEETKGGNS